MSVKINYIRKSFSQVKGNLILFTDDKFNLKRVKKDLSNVEYNYIKDLLKNCDLKKKLLFFEISSKKKNNFNFNKKQL